MFLFTIDRILKIRNASLEFLEDEESNYELLRYFRILYEHHENSLDAALTSLRLYFEDITDDVNLAEDFTKVFSKIMKEPSIALSAEELRKRLNESRSPLTDTNMIAKYLNLSRVHLDLTNIKI